MWSLIRYLLIYTFGKFILFVRGKQCCCLVIFWLCCDWNRIWGGCGATWCVSAGIVVFFLYCPTFLPHMTSQHIFTKHDFRTIPSGHWNDWTNQQKKPYRQARNVYWLPQRIFGWNEIEIKTTANIKFII